MTQRQETIEQLKERIGAIEWRHKTDITAYQTGVTEIDRALKHGGIAAGSCHEIICKQQGPALGFALSLLASMIRAKGPVLWCSEQMNFYTPGFLSYGIADTDIIFVHTRDQKQTLWAMEQGLSTQELSAVVIDTQYVSLAAGRRLKLLTQKYGSTALFMTKPQLCFSSPTIATTRWLVTAQPSRGNHSRNNIPSVGAARVQVNLLRNVGGQAPLSWMLEFNEQTFRFYTLPQLLPSTQENFTAESRISFGERTA